MQSLRLKKARSGFICALLFAFGLVVSGCGTAPDSGPAESKVTPTPAKIAISTENGLGNIKPQDAISVSVTDGELDSVEVLDQNGEPVAGEVTDGKWKAETGLPLRQTVTIVAKATGTDGNQVSEQVQAQTPNPQYVVEVDFLFAGGSTGSGMPIWTRFDMPVYDQAERKAIMDAATVKTTPEQEGSWGWMDEHTMYWRPKTYWEPSTSAHVEVNAAGLPVGDTWVLNNAQVDYTFGPNRVMKVDIENHKLSAFENGQLVREIPVTSGRKGFETMTGTKIIMEKKNPVVMDSSTFGIPHDSPGGYKLDVNLAQRITWSGEYLHAAPWDANSHGYANVSHGCTSMSIDNAQWLWNFTRLGDPVEFEGVTPKVQPADTYGAWMLSWDEWQKYADGTMVAPRGY